MVNPTEPDKTRQSETTQPELSLQQEAALAVLVAGGSHEKAAEAAGVTRQTVNGWRNREIVFIPPQPG